MICIGIGVLRKRLLLARRCSYCTIFALSTSLIHKKYREKFESALANRPAGVSAVAVIENLSITIIEEEL